MPPSRCTILHMQPFTPKTNKKTKKYPSPPPHPPEKKRNAHPNGLRMVSSCVFFFFNIYISIKKIFTRNGSIFVMAKEVLGGRKSTVRTTVLTVTVKVAYDPLGIS